MKLHKSFLLTLLGFFTLSSAAPHKEVLWTKLFDVKSINETYVPQAIEVYKDFVLFSVHAKDKKSALIVFKMSDEKLEYLFELDMPKEATHTSDFNVVGDTLYAIDYASNKIYQIDIPSLVNDRKLVIDDGFYLSMGRTGSLVIIDIEGEPYVFITQFIYSNKLKGFKLSELKNQTLDTSKIEYEITNHRFVQGLYSLYDMLLISTNNWGVDTITMVDIKKMLKTGNVADSTMSTINAPFKMVEDIAVYGNKIITSDEENNYIYISEDLTQNSAN